MNIFKFMFCALLFSYCSNSYSIKGTSKKIMEYQPNISIGYLDLKLMEPLVKEMNVDFNADSVAIQECQNWLLTDESVSNIITGMRKVDANEWYSLCYNYPCWYSAKVSNGKDEYQMNINAASYLTLKNDKETLIFILEKKSELFAIACDCCE